LIGAESRTIDSGSNTLAAMRGRFAAFDESEVQLRADRALDPGLVDPAITRQGGMLNLVSLLIGFVALLFAVVAFIPFLGWANWFIIPIAVVGAAIGVLSRGTSGRNLNLVVIVIGVIRLSLGGGIF